jgi:cytochrome c oxidase accessory protein FixG
MADAKQSSSKGHKPTGATEMAFYAKHEKIYPRKVTGIFAFWRATGVFVLLGLYYAVPWLSWDGRQAVLLDLPERKFYVFGLTLWPQDFFYVTALLIIAAISLFFFTAIAGRLWCGYACPQTVWTEAFLWIERKIEGDRPKHMKRDQAPWTLNKLMVKATKHSIWILFALYTGFTFVGYFTPIKGLTEKLLVWDMGGWETFWIFFYSFATWGNAGFMREQVCIYMCPYARFQSAMFDKDTLIISYDSERGEPRGSRRKGEDPKDKGLGDCIDCTLCVQVCPTGIDIRNGLQYQCIACASCIDVCDQVMEKVGYPKGLVRYTTEHALQGGKTHVVRPRLFVYAGILAIVMAGLVYSMATRIPLELDVIRDRIALYRENNEGLIENVYLLKVMNLDSKQHQYELKVSGITDLQLDTGVKSIVVNPGEVIELPVRLAADPTDLKKRSTEVTFHIQSRENDKLKVDEAARFLGPVSR